MANFWDDPSALQPKQQHRWVVSFGNRTIPHWFVKAVDKPSFTNKTVQAKYLYSHTFNFPTRVIWNPIKITLYDAYTAIRNVSDNGKTNLPKFYSNPYINPLGDQEREIKTVLAQIKANSVSEADIRFRSKELERLEKKISLNAIADDEGQRPPAYFSPQLFFYSFLQEAGYFNPEELDLEDKLLRFRDYTFKEKMVNSLLGSSDTDFDETKIPNDTRGFTYFEIVELDSNGEPLEAWKLYNPLISDASYDKLDYSADNIMTLNATISYDWAELVPRTEIEKPNVFVFEKNKTSIPSEVNYEQQTIDEAKTEIEKQKKINNPEKQRVFVSLKDKNKDTTDETTRSEQIAKSFSSPPLLKKDAEEPSPSEYDQKIRIIIDKLYAEKVKKQKQQENEIIRQEILRQANASTLEKEKKAT